MPPSSTDSYAKGTSRGKHLNMKGPRSASMAGRLFSGSDPRVNGRSTPWTIWFRGEMASSTCGEPCCRQPLASTNSTIFFRDLLRYYRRKFGIGR